MLGRKYGGAHAQSSLALCDPWTLALQAPLSMGFSRENTGVGWHVLLQGVFPAQGWNPGVLSLLHQQVHPSPLRHQGARVVPLSSAERGAGPLELVRDPLPPPGSEGAALPLGTSWAGSDSGGRAGLPALDGRLPRAPARAPLLQQWCPRPSGLSCLDLLCGSRQAAHDRE